ncbi:LuxR family transcriptional regulator [Streptacidiphilus pinicola]|uniref:LuxR family transcriptional regulator n=1 Tax=Streptacidiphilus pinicola TaxID=2219663 RepID=A0A2X0K1Q7_9ACTN|nr:LuxR C-terminal-related transcriptional regulator [Streptacidiphilus pinicola]RAG83195.1 LuxR family transcriptional regulator [Streptacidiphilus pinicola]
MTATWRDASRGQRRPGRLPTEFTSFVGRERDVAAVHDALTHSRTVTLVGPGGVGKSRVALRASRLWKARMPDGVWWADLSALRDPELLPATLAATLGLPEQSGMAPTDALVEHLSRRRLLLVLDTCEHLLDACAEVCELLLQGAPEVSVLATSRQPLDVPGESCLAVAPFAPADALELFAQRAASADPRFTVTEANRAQLLALVERLDGTPLALELAAMRLRAAPLAEFTARLDHSFEVLTGGRRTARSRHQTLRAAIDWSYDLCTPRERLLWARLSVFAGSFDIPAVEEVCTGGELARARFLEPLIGLVDKSVVQRTGPDGCRYRLLDTIREYGAERLAEQEDADAVHARHFEHFRELGRRFWDELLTGAQLTNYAAVRAELPDLRAAIGHAYTTEDLGREGRAAEGLWLATQLSPFWRAAGTLSEGAYWIEKGLALAPADCPERAWALLLNGMFAMWTADLGTAPERFAQAREVALRVGEQRVALFAEAYQGALLALCGEIEPGLTALDAARQSIVAAGDQLGMAVVHYEGALLRAVFGDTAGALQWCADGLRHLEGSGDRQFRASTLTVQGIIQWLAGEHEASAVALRDGLEAADEIGEALIAALACLGLGWYAAGRGRHAQAAWLLGYAEHNRRLTGDPVAMMPSLLDEQERVQELVSGALGAEAFPRHQLAGSRLTAGQVLDALRADADLPTPAGPDTPAAPRPAPVVAPPASAPSCDTLTPRELEVAGLVAQGLSNREVAERLVMSKRTADTHVERILAKLSIASRTQIPASLTPHTDRPPQPRRSRWTLESALLHSSEPE